MNGKAVIPLVAGLCNPYGIGAYAAGWMTADPDWKQLMLTGLPSFLQDEQYPFMVAQVGAMLLPAIVALALGAAILRLRGIAASIATLSLPSPVVREALPATVTPAAMVTTSDWARGFVARLALPVSMRRDSPCGDTRRVAFPPSTSTT